MSLRRLSRATATSSLKHSAPQLAAHLVRHALRNVLLHVCNVLALVVRVAVPAPFRGQGANSTTIVGSLRNDNWQELCARQESACGSRSGSLEIWDPCCQGAAAKLAKVRLGCNSSRRGCRLGAPGARTRRRRAVIAASWRNGSSRCAHQSSWRMVLRRSQVKKKPMPGGPAERGTPALPV